jgi:hypothetical protein
VDNALPRTMNEAIAAEFRANGGKVARFSDREILLLTTTGAKSGEARLSPLAYVTDGSPDRLVVFASHLGADHDRLHELFTSQLPGTEDHQSRTSRTIPMVVLERIVPRRVTPSGHASLR